MKAAVYIGIQLDWDYVNRTVTLSIPNYMRKALHIFQHILMGSKEYFPPYMCPNPVWIETPICGPFGCSRIPL